MNDTKKDKDSDNEKPVVHETGVFVGIGLNGAGNETHGWVYSMFSVFPDYKFEDAKGNYVSPYDEHGKRIPDDILTAREGVVRKVIELKLGEEIPLPFDNPELMQKIYKGKFAKTSAQERITKEYADGKTPREVYEGLLKDDLIILDPNRVIPEVPKPVSEILEVHHQHNVDTKGLPTKKRGG